MTSAGKSITGESRFFCCWRLPSQEMMVHLSWGLMDGVVGKDGCMALPECDTEDRPSQQGVRVRARRVQIPMDPDALSTPGGKIRR